MLQTLKQYISGDSTNFGKNITALRNPVFCLIDSLSKHDTFDSGGLKILEARGKISCGASEWPITHRNPLFFLLKITSILKV